MDLLELLTERPHLQPGDANQDLEFNFDDVLMVLSVGKFETGRRATWGEGDWNGAPGTSSNVPGNPPQGNGFFDFDDILAALRTGFYETGPYAAGGASNATAAAVPEPHAAILVSCEHPMSGHVNRHRHY